mmetsp:Transcript_27695/g.46856  ORF Transcript_27695/g.46856 Transcript_27695/m.46856 type:complete len:214 (+) Transcript_27695:380-1021(+)
MQHHLLVEDRHGRNYWQMMLRPMWHQCQQHMTAAVTVTAAVTAIVTRSNNNNNHKSNPLIQAGYHPTGNTKSSNAGMPADQLQQILIITIRQSVDYDSDPRRRCRNFCIVWKHWVMVVERRGRRMMDRMKWMPMICLVVVFRRQSGRRGVGVLLVRRRGSHLDFIANEGMMGERIMTCWLDRHGRIGMCRGDDIAILNGIFLRIVVVVVLLLR